MHSGRHNMHWAGPSYESGSMKTPICAHCDGRFGRICLSQCRHERTSCRKKNSLNLRYSFLHAPYRIPTAINGRGAVTEADVVGGEGWSPSFPYRLIKNFCKSIFLKEFLLVQIPPLRTDAFAETVICSQTFSTKWKMVMRMALSRL